MSERVRSFFESRLGGTILTLGISLGTVMVGDHYRTAAAREVQEQIDKQQDARIESQQRWMTQMSQLQNETANALAAVKVRADVAYDMANDLQRRRG